MSEHSPKSSSGGPHPAILEDLEAVRENLLALSDDIWAGIDRQDLSAFDEGVRFMRSYVEKMTQFDRLAVDLSVLIQQYTQVSLEATEETGQEDREQNERIIQDLNREEPHTLDEDLTYKRPHGSSSPVRPRAALPPGNGSSSWRVDSSTSVTLAGFACWSTIRTSSAIAATTASPASPTRSERPSGSTVNSSWNATYPPTASETCSAGCWVRSKSTPANCGSLGPDRDAGRTSPD